MKRDHEVVFQVETHLLDESVIRARHVSIDHLTDKKQRIFEHVEFRALLRGDDIRLHQRMNVVPIRQFRNRIVMVHPVDVDPCAKKTHGEAGVPLSSRARLTRHPRRRWLRHLRGNICHGLVFHLGELISVVGENIQVHR